MLWRPALLGIDIGKQLAGMSICSTHHDRPVHFNDGYGMTSDRDGSPFSATC
jgi:hypothetical protein